MSETEVKTEVKTEPDAATTAAINKKTETMADYEDAINKSMRKIYEGDILKGTVLDVNEEEIVIDLQYYAEGVIKAEDYSDDPTVTAMDEVKVGDEIEATVIKRDDGHGRILLSKKEANSVLAWERLKGYMDNQKNVKVKVAEVVNKGVVAYLEGIRGFIPASKLALDFVEDEDLEKFLNQVIEVRVINVDKGDKKLVMSAKEILMEERREKEKRMASNVEVGLVTEGVVESLQKYGAFVRLSNGLTGLLHISQISNVRIKHPGVVLKEGETVKVKVIGINDGKISLSKKALEDVSASEITEEEVELPQSEELGTSLGSLLAGLKF
ncbi:MAG: S1 RNA-binding domain-containing protein, partial [Lachnospiraceae bacterium]|nr:S1 RNA-binding domain-containing protein [Lachnospiraceae bacterium]